MARFEDNEKYILKCCGHFDVALKMTLKNSKTGVTSPMFVGKGSPKQVSFFFYSDEFCFTSKFVAKYFFKSHLLFH